MKTQSDADVTTRYYYDGNRVLLEEEDPGTGYSDARYFAYGNYIDEVLLMHDTAAAEDYYYGHDHLFSPCVLFDDIGAVAERYEYNAYGKATIWDATFTTSGNTSNYANPYLFTGRRLDILDNGSLEIYYYRARYYDADTGRFLQKDPFGVDSSKRLAPRKQYSDGLNLYQYVKSLPTFALDPTGLWAFPSPVPNPLPPPWVDLLYGQCSPTINYGANTGMCEITCEQPDGPPQKTNSPVFDKQELADHSGEPMGPCRQGDTILYFTAVNIHKESWSNDLYPNRTVFTSTRADIMSVNYECNFHGEWEPDRHLHQAIFYRDVLLDETMQRYKMVTKCIPCGMLV